ncbi:ABC transporter substrate-binding protein [Alteribacillus sp. HJP-4]|uniref:ABC transporter substrate-binding protein n=1 Tax=Alteribacillus sp. HJP-4 TaxID=2775394 RepID=UPI0035CD1D53
MKASALWPMIIILTLIITACSNNDEASEEVDEEDLEETTEITAFMPEHDEMNFEENSFTKLMEDEYNIDFEFETTSWDGTAANERRQISLASGDYPDVYYLIPWVDQFSPSDLIRYGKQGVLLPLNDLIEEHAPNLQAVLDEDEEFRAMATAPDGNIYGVPQLVECFHCTWGNKMWLNTSWLDELDLETPETHEEFKETLMAFRDEDPNGNGEQDEIPLSGSTMTQKESIIPFLMNGFIYDDLETRLLIEDGKVDFAANKEEWRDGLEYIRSLYDEGLIDPGAFTQNADAYMQLGNEEPNILGAAPAVHIQLFTDNDNQYDFDALAPLEGPNAAYSSYTHPIEQGATFALTNKASSAAQIKSIQVLDYMFTEEGSLRAFFGEEGEGWKKPEEGDVAINEDVEPIYVDIPEGEDETLRNDNWAASAQYYHPVEFRDGIVQVEDIYTEEGFERRLQEATYLYEDQEPEDVFPYWGVWYGEDVQDEIAELETNILDNVDQSAVRFITGDLSLEDDWDDYIAGLESLGVERYVEINQDAYDKYLENVE